MHKTALILTAAWALPGNRTVNEVSRNGKNRQGDIDALRRGIVTPMLKTGIVPLDGSKCRDGQPVRRLSG